MRRSPPLYAGSSSSNLAPVTTNRHANAQHTIVSARSCAFDDQVPCLSGDVSEDIDHRRPLNGTTVLSEPLVDVELPVGGSEDQASNPE
ncbi:hypothetical protein VTO73DRAFT_15096 [Trametes versicolor]